MTRILVVVSAADRGMLIDGTAHPTGYWAEELAGRAGMESTLARLAERFEGR